MKRLIAIVCVLVIVLQVGCASRKESLHEYSVETNLVVEPGDVGPSFLLKNGNLYGWTSMNNRDDSYLVNKNNLILMSDVESFKYPDSVWDNMHSNDYGAMMLYSKKSDGSFWMRGYDIEASFDENVIHNYKEFTKVMDNVKNYYKKIGPAVYVIKEDDSLWYWINEGKKQNKNAVPKIVAENVTKFVKYGDSESGFPDVYYRNDNSAFVVGSKREVIELGSDVKNAFCYNNEYGTKHDEFYILHTNGELHKFNPIKNKKVLINSNVKDFCSSGQVENLWILKEDNSLVNYKGKVVLENVDNIYMSESIQFGNLFAIADNKVYELIDKGPNYLFDLEE